MAHCIKNILLRPLYSFSLSNWFLFSLFLGMDNGAHFSFVSNVHPRQHTSTMGNKQQKKEGGAKPYTARKFFLLLIILAVPCTDSRSTQTQSPCRLLYTNVFYGCAFVCTVCYLWAWFICEFDRWSNVDSSKFFLRMKLLNFKNENYPQFSKTIANFMQCG